MDYTVLKKELEADPLGLGYEPLLASGNDTGLCALLNSHSGLGTGTVNLSSVSRTDFLLAIAPAYLVLPTLNASVQAKWDRILAVIGAADRIDCTDPRVQALLSAAVIDGVLTSDQAIAINQCIGSRAEVLLGPGTELSIGDISFALRKVR
jgi:hypothetical protein